MTIAIYGKAFRSDFYQYILEFFEKIKRYKVQCFIHQEFYDFLINNLNLNPHINGIFTGYEDLSPEVELIFSIGGDGTFIETVSIIRERAIPVIGINSGRLGFLANIAKEDLPNALHHIFEGRYDIEERSLIELIKPDHLFPEFNFALNEITLHKLDTASMITVQTYVDGVFLNSYWADGIIIATPTGSTAYSLSAGGPITYPGSEVFIVSPIAPHNLTVRPIVLPDNLTITCRIEGRSPRYLASLDRRSTHFEAGTEFTIKRAGFKVKMIKLAYQDFFSTLRHKLMWGADKRN